jgi:hypothetical protein
MTDRLRAPTRRPLRNRVSLSRFAPLAPLALLALAPLIACGSSSPHDASGSGSGTGADSDGGAGSSGYDSTTDAADDAGVVLIAPNDDASSDGATGCGQLRIGILGLPGDDASSNFQAWLVSSGTSVASIQTTSTDTLTAAELAPFDVVILNKLQRDYTPAEAALFAAWVQAGGGVAAMSGFENDTTTDWHANTLLAPLEIAYADPLFVSGPVTDFATQPVTTGLTSVTFEGGYAIADLGGTASTRTPIAFLPYSSADGGDLPVGYAVTMGNGRAFAWGDEWIQFDSQWSTIPQIKQLWVQVFGWIAPSTKCALKPPQ